MGYDTWSVKTIVSVVITQGQVFHFTDKLLFKVFSIVNFAFMQIKQEQKHKSDKVALQFQIFDCLYVEKDMSMDLSEAQKDA